jgi:predicted TIM-barrel fold metal-dependent hydrolase
MTTIESMGAGRAKVRRRCPLPRPEPRPRRFSIVSVDDHLVEPRDVFEGRLPRRYAAQTPHVVVLDGVDAWVFDGEPEPFSAGNAPASWSLDELSGGPTSYDEMLPGAWDVHERIRDMDVNGIYASLNFPSMAFGFAGQRFSRMRDKDFGLACMRAYNDWVMDAWTAPYPDRMIPCQVTWLAEPAVAAAEVMANARRGFKAVTFTENPEKLGYASIHSGAWDTFFRACEETGTVVNLHVGSSSVVTQPSTDSPLPVVTSLIGLNSIAAASDWAHSHVPVRFPDIVVVLSEGGIDWVPMLLSRLRSMEKYDPNIGRGVRLATAETLLRNFRFAALWDTVGFKLLDLIGEDNVMLESDYPHGDSTFPDTQQRVADQLDGLPDDTVRKLTYSNACAVYRHPLPVDFRGVSG